MLHFCPHPSGYDSGTRQRQLQGARAVCHCVIRRQVCLTAVIAAAVCSHPQRCPADHLCVLQDKSLYHPVSGSCMDCSVTDHRIFMNTCNPSSPTQQWLFEHTNSTVLEKFNSN